MQNNLIKNPIFRSFVFLFGIISLVLGFFGIFLPVLPTTPFMLLAAWCFLKSSPKIHQWLHRQPYLSRILNDWEKNQAISRRSKLVAILMISASAIWTWIKIKIFPVKILVLLILLGASIFIVTRNEPAK